MNEYLEDIKDEVLPLSSGRSWDDGLGFGRRAILDKNDRVVAETMWGDEPHEIDPEFIYSGSGVDMADFITKAANEYTALVGMVEELRQMVGQWQYLDMKPKDDVTVGGLLDRAYDLLARQVT